MATETSSEQDPENPLSEGLERLPVHPTTLTIFGATGDLAKRKLLPALYNLAHEGALPERFNLIGCSRTEYSDDEFRELAKESIEEFSRRET
ncbi:MAG: glucose-6-phosphate dehydrogenase, partial [Actinobacteria bacterium]|nr:glucose-6-phosphate dehydrogenase [Actinomycetota bacterium]